MREPDETILHVGGHVECDFCSKEFTDSTESGGFLFGSYAVGPCCAATPIRADERKHIKGRCPEGMSFRDFVLKLRGGDNTIRIMRFNQPEE